MSEAFPEEPSLELRQIRKIVGLGRRAVHKYIEDLNKSTNLTPIEIMHLAQCAHQDGKLQKSYNEIAGHILTYVQQAYPHAVLRVTQQINEFFVDLSLPSDITIDQVMAEARAQMPRRMVKQAARAYAYPHEPPKEWLEGPPKSDLDTLLPKSDVFTKFY